MSRFQAGALVVYGNLGVHEVEGVGLRRFCDEPAREYYTLRPYFSDSHDRSYIPTAKEGALRPVPRHSRRKPIWHASKRCDHVEKATEFQREAMSPDGCSLGGACLTRLLALGKIPVEPLNARLDKDSRSNWSKYRICFIIHILSFAVGRAFLLPS